MPELSFDTPTGPFTLTDDAGEIVAATWRHARRIEATPLLLEAKAQVTAYFEGTLQAFDLPLAIRGTDFQQAVCRQIAAIPFGETTTYGDLARNLGAPAQAVGQGCGANPIALIIPCHRVLGANGLGGFSGGKGIETKVALLRNEGAAGLLI